MTAKRRRGARSKPRKPDDAFTAGPLRVERRGRLVNIGIQWDPEEFQAMRASLPGKRDDLRAEIATSVERAVEIIRAVDPLPLLFSIFARNCLVDPETYSEPEHEGVEARVEYAHSLVTAVANPGTAEPDEQQHQEFAALVDGILSASQMYFMIRDETDADGTAETRLLGMMRHLYIRGSSVVEHDTELLRLLFEPHVEFFRRNNLFTPNELVDFCDGVESTINASLAASLSALQKMKVLHEKFVAETTDETDSDTLARLIEEIRNSPAARDAARELKAAQDQAPAGGHEVTVNGATTTICSRLSLTPGDNSSFLTFAKSPGWPSNSSRIYGRPLVELRGRVYCPSPVLLIRNRALILEETIRETDAGYYANQFASSRGKLLESLALQHFRRLLPKAQVFENVYYRTDDGSGDVQRYEADGLVIFEDRLFVLEMKSAPFSAAALRGAETSLRNDLKHLLEEPYQQGLRTLRFLARATPARFEHADGSHAVTVPGLAGFRQTYVVNVTLSDIGHVAARLNSAKKMGFIGGTRWPWSVFVNDLRVISELIDTPAEFLLYLQRRLALNDIPAISTIDELDYLGMFLHDGLYFEPEDLGELDRLSFTGYTVPIERYYDHRAGRVSSGPKPQLRVSDWYRDLVSRIQASGKAGASYVAMTLLGLDGDGQNSIESWFQTYGGDARPHRLTLQSKEFPLLVVSVSPDGVSGVDEQRYYVRVRRAATDASSAICVTFVGPTLDRVDFEILEGIDGVDTITSEQIAGYRRAKYAAHVKAHGKPGPNAPCPCDSGLKFKRCCRDLSDGH